MAAARSLASPKPPTRATTAPGRSPSRRSCQADHSSSRRPAGHRRSNDARAARNKRQWSRWRPMGTSSAVPVAGLDQHDPPAVPVGRQADNGATVTPFDSDDGRARCRRRRRRRPTGKPKADNDDVRAARIFEGSRRTSGAGGSTASSQSHEPRRCFSTAETGMPRSAATIRATSRPAPWTPTDLARTLQPRLNWKGTAQRAGRRHDGPATARPHRLGRQRSGRWCM